MKLSDRLENMISRVEPGERAADVGTDHGLLPMALYERGIAKRLILSDINEGPLEKARANLDRHGHKKAPGAGEGELWADGAFELRKGPGLEPLARGEVDAVTLAGMGGRLIIDILSADGEKSRSFKKYILQPRNAAEKLREWLDRRGYAVWRDELATEGRHICQIMCASPIVGTATPETPDHNQATTAPVGATVTGRPKTPDHNRETTSPVGATVPGRPKTPDHNQETTAPVGATVPGRPPTDIMSALTQADAAYDMSAELIARKDPLLAEWLKRNLRKFGTVIENMSNSDKTDAKQEMERLKRKRDAYASVLGYIDN